MFPISISPMWPQNTGVNYGPHGAYSTAVYKYPKSCLAFSNCKDLAVWALKCLISTVSMNHFGTFKVFFDVRFQVAKKPSVDFYWEPIGPQEMIATSSSACCCERSSNPSIGALAKWDVPISCRWVLKGFCCYICGLHSG